MDYDSALSSLSVPFKVFIVDLLLSGDNAVMIALACRSLAPQMMRKAVLYGTMAAIALRFIMAAMIGGLLLIPGLKLVGAAMLLIIAIKLMAGEDALDDSEGGNAVGANLWSAVRIIIVADVVMSLDNVVAVAAVAQSSLGYLALGLLLSIPLLIYGSLFVSGLLNRYPILITAGGALLAWTAGDLAVSDPAISGWIETQSFALSFMTPFAAAVFAILHSGIIAEHRGMKPMAIESRPKVRRVFDDTPPRPPPASVAAYIAETDTPRERPRGT